MTRAPLTLCLVLCPVLAGCGGGGLGGMDLTPFETAEPRGIELETDAGGLAIFGTDTGGQRIDFGRAPSGVIGVLERELGPGTDMGLKGCPTNIRQQIAWGDLVLTFTDEQFVGWRALTGEAGYTCGTMA